MTGIVEKLLNATIRNTDSKETARARFLRFLAFVAPARPAFEIIKITGTNGKGSTCAMLEAGLLAAGKRVGVFTSPHLVDITERFRIDGQDISPDEFETFAQKWLARLEDLVRQKGEAYRPSFFDVLIVMALDIFQTHGVDFAIFEAGIGGYNDSVSCLPGRLSAITSVGADHLARLGPTLADVAADKAGIASDGSRLILGPDIDETLQAVILADARPRGVAVSQGMPDVFRVEALGADGFRVETENGQSYRIPLSGNFQVSNFSIVYEMFKALVELGFLQDMDGLAGVAQTSWPGRMEYFAGAPAWLLDVAHNPPAFQAAVEALDGLFPRNRRVLLYGAAQEKDYAGCIPFLPAIAPEIHLLDDFYRAAPAATLAPLLPGTLQLRDIFPSAQVAFETLTGRYRATDKVIIVIGSVFLAGKMRNILVNQNDKQR